MERSFYFLEYGMNVRWESIGPSTLASPPSRTYKDDHIKGVIHDQASDLHGERWDEDVSLWSGYSDAIPAAADAPTLDELLARISAMALDLLPDNQPGVDPSAVFVQINALREADPAAA